MAKHREVSYKLLPEWRIVQNDKSLTILGGADARYAIELDDDKPSFFAKLKPNKLFKRTELNERDVRVLEELVTAEIVVPIIKKGKSFKYGIVGDGNKLALKPNNDIISSDLLVVIRTNSNFAQLLEKIDYQNIKKPHLFVDMAYHHTLSIGPLVFPGETACIACLQGRVTTRWGDETPPSSPNVTSQYLGIASELILSEIDRISKDDTSLTNKTLSWNFRDRIVKKDQLLKVPLCPVCTQNIIDRSGSITLPWGRDENITNTI